MFTERNISIYDFVCALTEAVDLVFTNLNNHHKKVVSISFMIAKKMNLSNEEIQDIILASMLHDIGAFSNADRAKLLKIDLFDDDINHHAMLGYKILKDFEPLEKVAVLIKYHHTSYDGSRNDIPIGSYIIHLADRISIMLDERREILKQVPELCAQMAPKRNKYHPQVFMSFISLAKTEAFWIEAFSPLLVTSMLDKIRFPKETMDLDTLRKFAKVFVNIIDYRSRFTATHSSGVAAVALELAIIDGLSEEECKLMEVAGLLHDLGKLTVPNEILEKNGSLDAEEVLCIKKHTYYTYAILSKIKDLEHIASWAAHHHERMDGNGYPFHVKGENFSKFARIIAVADVVTALSEDRPYRLGISTEKTLKILDSMTANGGIDKNIVTLVQNNFQRINDSRVKAQSEALKEYEAFRGEEKEMIKMMSSDISSDIFKTQNSVA